MVLKFILFLALTALVGRIHGERKVDPKLVLKKISATIGEYVLICQKKTGFSQDVLDTFLSFWSYTTPLEDPAAGCVVTCFMGQLELIKADGNLNKDNAAAFLAAKGSDEFTKEIIIELYDLCKDIISDKKGCYFGIELAKCFRGGILMRDWVPDSLDPNADDEVNDYTENEEPK